MQNAINDSETVCSPIIQASGFPQVFLFSFNLLKRVMTEIANPTAIGIAQLKQTNTVICQLIFFSKYYPMSVKRIFGFCGSMVLIRGVQKQRKEQLKKTGRQQPDRLY